MDFIRVYTGPDGAAHFEPVTGELAGAWAKGVPATQCAIRPLWPPAPSWTGIPPRSGRWSSTCPAR